MKKRTFSALYVGAIAALGLPLAAQSPNAPLDGAYVRDACAERMSLTYDHVRESDVMWEKTVWREIPVQELINKTFAYPKMPFFDVLKQEAQSGKITLYENNGDKYFKKAIAKDSVQQCWSRVDTVITFNPETMVENPPTAVYNTLNSDDIVAYRLKESWFFDKETSRMEVRIIGIAPIITKKNEMGDVLFTYPMFWVYYPEARHALNRHEAFNDQNEGARLSWEDIFESRMFGSFITKEGNVLDQRIQDYKKDPLAALVEADKIHSEIFNFEHDLWNY